MNLDAFLAEREPEWDTLEATLKRAGGRPERLGADGALALGRGYRAAVADLALARRRYPGDPVVERLERLVLAARQAVYGRRRGTGTLVWLATRRYWQLVAERPGMLALAALATFAPCLLAGLWALHDPGAALGLVPGQFQPAAHPHIHKLAFGATTQAALASSIFTNNIQVTFLAFGGGLLLGAGSLAVLAYNGAILGALGGLTLGAGNFAVFVRYIVPHGILELSCFTVAGAAGLRLGWALIDAGTLPRGESLRRAARPAVGMILGTAPCLIVAGLTEGFVTPRGLPLAAALAVGIVLGGGFWTLVLTRGRPVTAAPAASP
ncbi:MAG TPA: stage II sporulation protein M [Solirubrobacteraceae bacterium]|nr:stage II sporulation protein M [Solirubrobacteraceae bacterium]